jgi:aryl-alcohol dehydrogenase-like predicted oxidoreductase
MSVSPVALGTMMLGSAGNPDHDECVRIVHRALDRGINFLDTADMYSGGECEEIVGAALTGRRDDVILATKGHFPLADGPNRSGNSRRYLTRAVEASLRRLDTDYIDLYQVHRPDWTTDLEETLAVLTDLVRAGKIRAFGCSTFPAHEIVEAHHVAERRGLHRFRTEQPPYNILARGIERDVLLVAERCGMGVVTWSPLGFGFLTGRYRKGATPPVAGRASMRPEWFDPADPVTARKLDIVEQLVGLSSAVGCTLPALATSFPLAHRAVTSVIIGPRTPEQLEDSLATMDLRLDDDVRTASTKSSLPEVTSTARSRRLSTCPGSPTRSCGAAPVRATQQRLPRCRRGRPAGDHVNGRTRNVTGHAHDGHVAGRLHHRTPGRRTEPGRDQRHALDGLARRGQRQRPRRLPPQRPDQPDRL